MKRFLLTFTLRAALLGAPTVLAVGCSSNSEPNPSPTSTGSTGDGSGTTSGTSGVGQTIDGVTIGGVSNPTTACDGACVDVLTDRANCGACGVACESGSQCKSGACEGCGEGLSDCNGSCVDLQTSSNHCGTCESACSLGAPCVNGACATCDEGLSECDGSCVDTSFNTSHCGACNTTCGADELCASGECRKNTCFGPNELPCGEDNACVDVVNNKEHCGACGQVCPGDMRCIPADGGSRCGCDSKEPCDGQCTDTKWDANNCGGCGVECAEGQRCHDGSCLCDLPLQLCGGSCKEASACEGGGTGARLPLPGSLHDFAPLKATPISENAGDGSVDCSPEDGGDGGGNVAPNPDAGEHCGADTWTQGKSTWYTLATPLVHCGYPTETLPTYYGAINDAQYGNADVCGACVEIEADGKVLEIQVVDECPYVGNERWCYAGSNHIDLNPAAFEFFHAPVKGVFDMNWRYVPCSGAAYGGTSPELEYTFKEGSSIYWTGIMIRNHPIPIMAVEVAGNTGTFRALERQEYNFWLLESGVGSGPYTLRITDTSGSVLEKSGIPSLTGTPLETNTSGLIGGQLQSCQ